MTSQTATIPDCTGPDADVRPSRVALREAILRDLTFSGCFEPTEALLGHPDYRAAFEVLPADLSRPLDGTADEAAAFFRRPHVLGYILDWAARQAQTRATTITFDLQLSKFLVGETLYRLYNFIVSGDGTEESGARKLSRQPLVTLIREGRIETYADVAGKIGAIARGRPYRELKDELRRAPNHDDLDGIASDIDIENSDRLMEHLFAELLVFRAYLRLLGRSVATLEERSRRLKPGQGEKLADLAFRIANLRAEIAYNRRHLHDGTATRADIAARFGADAGKMSGADTYARKRLREQMATDMRRVVDTLGLDVAALAASHAVPAHVVETVLDLGRPA